MIKNSKLLSHLFYLFIFILSFTLSVFISKQYEKPIIVVSKQQSSLNINQFFWDYFHLGQKRLFSSVLWIATILESDHEHYKKRDYNSWMFLRFKAISNLDHKFLDVYSFGAPYLSIVKDDLNGASFLYQKGLSYYPDNYKLLLNSGFHFYFEVNDYSLAKLSFEKLINHPKSPQFVYTSLARINAHNGSKLDAYNLLTEYQKQLPQNSTLERKTFEYRYQLKAEIDLECLNSNNIKSTCEHFDLEGNRYYLKDGIYYSRKSFKRLEVQTLKKFKSSSNN